MTSRNITKDQQQRLLNALRHGPVTAQEARERLNVPAIAARIYELRHQGFQITTTLSGRKAVYALVGDS